MKLSDAIMLNGMTKPQGRGHLSIHSVDAPCAIGGALQVIGKQSTTIPYSVFKFAWPWTEQRSLCPDCSDEIVNGTVTQIIFHLNDKHEWTRQQIAAWVARIEPEERLSLEDAWNDAQHCQAAISWSCEAGHELP